MKKGIIYIIILVFILMGCGSGHKQPEAPSQVIQNSSEQSSSFETYTASGIEQLILAQRYDEGIQAANIYLESNPGDMLVKRYRGIAYSKKGHSLTAFKDLLELVQKEPSVENYLNYGIALHQAGYCERAALAYRAALELSPMDYQIMTNLGSAYACYGRHEESIQFLEKAISLNPQNEIIETNLAIAKFLKDDMVKSLEHAEKAIQLNPQYFQAYYFLYRYYTKMGDLELAKSYLEKTLSLIPNSRLAKNQ